MSRNCSLRVLALLLMGFLVSSGGSLFAGMVAKTFQMRAIQQVNLFGVDATLVANGPVLFNFEVDANNNTIPGGNSFVDAFFTGILPSEFAAIGVGGAPFELFSLPGSQVLTASGNGTHVSLSTTFGLRVFAAPGVVGANFYTSVPSLFESDVISLTNFSESVFGDPSRPNDVTSVFIGDNLLGVPPGTQVGISFNRTVTTVPEPSSMLVFGLLGLVGCGRRSRWRR